LSYIPEKQFTITAPKRPIYITIIVAFIFTAYVGLCYYFISKNKDLNGTIKLLIILGIVVFNYMILPNISEKTMYIDFSKEYYKMQTEIGRLTIPSQWKKLKQLKYISVFKTNNGYEVNLWHSKNKILNLFVYDDFNAVIEKAFFFAERFNIPLLDARIRGYHRWIDKEIFKTTGEIEYED